MYEKRDLIWVGRKIGFVHWFETNDVRRLAHWLALGRLFEKNDGTLLVRITILGYWFEMSDAWTPDHRTAWKRRYETL